MTIIHTLCQGGQGGISSALRPHRTGAVFSILSGAVIRVVCALLTWQERANQRRNLASLDDRMLRDIGIDRAAARREAEKPFWQA